MSTRIAIISIIVENHSSVEKINALLHAWACRTVSAASV